MNQWCVVVVRNLRCTEGDSGKEVNVEDVVTVYGPFSKAVAIARANQFNAEATAASRVSFESGAPDEYRPIINAPAFIDQEHWIEHWAITRPMNDVEW